MIVTSDFGEFKIVSAGNGQLVVLAQSLEEMAKLTSRIDGLGSVETAPLGSEYLYQAKISTVDMAIGLGEMVYDLDEPVGGA